MPNFDSVESKMDLTPFRIRRPVESMAAMSAVQNARRGPLRADHSIRVPVQTSTDSSASKLNKYISADSTPTPLNRKRRTPSPHAKRLSKEVTPSRPNLKRLRRPMDSPPLKRRSVQLSELTQVDCSSYPLFKDVNCIVRDECEDSPLQVSSSSISSSRSSSSSSLDSVYSTPRRSRSNSVEDISDDKQSDDETPAYRMFSPPRFLPYGSVDGDNLSPTDLPRHTSDTALLNLLQPDHRHMFASATALNEKNVRPRCSSPEPIRPIPSIPTTPKVAEPQIRGRTSKRPQRRSSLSERLDSLKTKAKSTIVQIKRVVSTDRLHRRSSSKTPTQTPEQSSLDQTCRSSSTKRSPSIKSRSSSRRRSKSPLRSLMSSMSRSRSPGRWCSAGLDKSDMDGSSFVKRQFTTIGKLMAIHQDGTQTVLLERSSETELPFSLTKSPQEGVVISSLDSTYPDLYFAGLVNVLDEIVEINNEPCDDLCLDQVKQLLNAKTMTMVRIRPNLRRHGDRQQ